MASNTPQNDYAGDLSAGEAWALLESDPRAQLVDVRTTAEWNFVGLPDLSSVGREALLVEWQSFPTMRPNPNFVGDAAAREARPPRTRRFSFSAARARARAPQRSR